MICCRCKEDKPPEAFYADKNARGRRYKCKLCQDLRNYRLTLGVRFCEHRNRAKWRNKEWQLTLEQYKSLIWRKPCFYCGAEANGGMDRVNNEPLYSPSNVIPCCGRCNIMKSTDTLSRFLERVNLIAKRHEIVVEVAA